MAEIERVTAAQATELLPGLVELLQDAVASGASLGFWHPLDEEAARRFWQGVIGAVADGYTILLVARQGEQVVGTVQLALATRQNAPHRAEVQKLMVHRAVRRQGLGRRLLVAIEEEARQAGRSLLILDTLEGQPAEQMYIEYGYLRVGMIPDYTVEADGSKGATVVFYRLLETA